MINEKGNSGDDGIDNKNNDSGKTWEEKKRQSHKCEEWEGEDKLGDTRKEAEKKAIGTRFCGGGTEGVGAGEAARNEEGGGGRLAIVAESGDEAKCKKYAREEPKSEIREVGKSEKE